MVAQMLQFAAFFGGLGGRSDDGEGTNPLAALAMIILAPIAAMLIQMAISRSREYGADDTGAHIVGDPLALASALEKLEAWSQRVPMDVNPAVAPAVHRQPAERPVHRRACSRPTRRSRSGSSGCARWPATRTDGTVRAPTTALSRRGTAVLCRFRSLGQDSLDEPATYNRRGPLAALTMPEIAVVVVNWNGAHLLRTCLGSLRRQTFPDFETILVDNGSTDDSLALVAREFPEVRVLALDREPRAGRRHQRRHRASPTPRSSPRSTTIPRPIRAGWRRSTRRWTPTPRPARRPRSCCCSTGAT